MAFGAFVTNRDSHVRLDSSRGQGTDISVEDDLGFDPHVTVARLDGHFWFNERHRIDATYFDLNRSAEHKVDRTINFGDTTYTINTTVNGEQDFQIVKLDYTYALLVPDRGFLGLTGGLYVSQSKYSLRAGSASGESQDLTAPAVVGLAATSLSPTGSLSAALGSGSASSRTRSMGVSSTSTSARTIESRSASPPASHTTGCRHTSARPSRSASRAACRGRTTECCCTPSSTSERGAPAAMNRRRRIGHIYLVWIGRGAIASKDSRCS